MACQKPRYGGAHNMEFVYTKSASENEKCTMEEWGLEAEPCQNVRKEKSGRRHGHDHTAEASPDLGSNITGGDGSSLCTVTSSRHAGGTSSSQTHERFSSSHESDNLTQEYKDDPGSSTSAHATVGSSETATGLDEYHETAYVKALMFCFQRLGIQACPKPYARLAEQPRSQSSPEENKDGRACSDYDDTEFTKTPKPRRDCKEELSGISPSGIGNASSETHCPAALLYCKNLFLKDRKGQFYLVIVSENSSVDLKQLKQELTAHRNLSFADKDSMWSILRVEPGYVSPFSVMLDSAKNIKLAIDRTLTASDTRLAFHPMDSTLQVEITFKELEVFVKSFGHTLQLLGKDDTSQPPMTGSKEPTSLKPESKKRNILNNNEITNVSTNSKPNETGVHKGEQSITNVSVTREVKATRERVDNESSTQLVGSGEKTAEKETHESGTERPKQTPFEPEPRTEKSKRRQCGSQPRIERPQQRQSEPDPGIERPKQRQSEPEPGIERPKQSQCEPEPKLKDPDKNDARKNQSEMKFLLRHNLASSHQHGLHTVQEQFRCPRPLL
ncbi:uncharacterized protein LOC101864342 [Aplysia californica]|uniref:PrdX deacylase domain-containing protein 1 n=1 Tax=Aplysia californica TaxID=6500 RepID=A0ABM0K785_APLCA|nr:uncharacterized protein LOC101864342 [Aplysia californica]